MAHTDVIKIMDYVHHPLRPLDGSPEVISQACCMRLQSNNFNHTVAYTNWEDALLFDQKGRLRPTVRNSLYAAIIHVIDDTNLPS